MTPLQVFLCGFCEIFKKSLFDRTPPMAVSVNGKSYQKLNITIEMKKSI